jgi:hypothetical protein
MLHTRPVDICAADSKRRRCERKRRPRAHMRGCATPSGGLDALHATPL